MKPTPKALEALKTAKAARAKAHAPYSGFQVGAGLVAKSAGKGDKAAAKIFGGCNVENASYGGTVCAERTAIFKAVSEGVTEFSDIVVVTDAEEPAFPCALCLQVMAEFFDPESKIWIANLGGIRSMHSFAELLPKPFGPQQLKKAKK